MEQFRPSGTHFQVNIYAGLNITRGIKIKLMTRHLVQVTDMTESILTSGPASESARVAQITTTSTSLFIHS
jgi:hypothetical protein